MAQLSFVVFSDQEEFSSEMRSMLERSGHAEVIGSVSERDDLVELLRARRPDALFADLGRAPHDGLDLLEQLGAPRPALLVCGPQEDGRLILRAMRQGVREFLPPVPDPDVVADAVQRMALELAPATPNEKRAALVAVMGSKGGVGATLTACQLASALQAVGGRTLLVDMDLPLGDAALHLDLRPEYTLASVSEGEELDATYLRGILQSHGSGVHFLAGTSRIEEAELLSPARVDKALGLLRAEFDWLVVNLSHRWDETCVGMLDVADLVLVVTQHDVPTLHRARQHLELLERLGHSGRKVHLVANRAAKTDTVTAKDFEQYVGRAPEARIPDDPVHTAIAVNEGRTVAEVAPGSPLDRGFRELAHRVYEWCGVELPGAGARRGILARVRRKLRKQAHGTA